MFEEVLKKVRDTILCIEVSVDISISISGWSSVVLTTISGTTYKGPGRVQVLRLFHVISNGTVVFTSVHCIGREPSLQTLSLAHRLLVTSLPVRISGFFRSSKIHGSSTEVGRPQLSRADICDSSCVSTLCRTNGHLVTTSPQRTV